MFKCRNNTFWLQNPINLICTCELIPLDNMNFADQMNSITRLVLLVFFILIMVDFKHSTLFLLLSLLFIIILYYIQRSQMIEKQKEFFTPTPKNLKKSLDLYHQPNKDLAQAVYHPKPGLVNHDIYKDPMAFYWCDNEQSLEGPNGGGFGPGVVNNCLYMSPNQKLVGAANPRTLVAPVVAPPAAELEFWKTNNAVVHSAINEQTQVEQYQNGYQIQTCCAPIFNGTITPTISNEPKDVPLKIFQKDPDVIENYSPNPRKEPNNIIENYEGPIQTTRIQTKEPWIINNEKGEGSEATNVSFEYPFLKVAELPLKTDVIIPNEPGLVDDTCGYNPNQLLKAGLPANLPAGYAQQDRRMKKYNQELFNQTIQPGVYTTNQVNEPLNSNIGISFTQQFEPVISKTDPVTGEIYYREIDPRIINPDDYKEERPKMDMSATEANIYDPRFTGYGTGYRSYTDDFIGQPRYYYDDVDAIRMPNYLTRNEIDTQPFADSYGPMKEGEEFGNKYNAEIKALAGNAFVDRTIKFRTELQERLMRKANARQWQLRKAPIRTGGQRMLGNLNFGA